jgi:4'-phosphopantetheinyl transferase
MWQTPPINLQLTPQEVHLWQVDLDLPLEQVQALLPLLSEDEVKRANRFYFEQHRQRFIVARGTLRKLLGSYLDMLPEQIQFNYSSRGKPSLVNGNKTDTIQFNVSHSQGLALYGFTLNSLIGVDLEFIRTMPDAESIAKRFFTSRESELIKSVVPDSKNWAFFQLWTAKEAYLKASGDGIAGGLDQVEVDMILSESIGLLNIAGDVEKAKKWRLYSFVPRVDFMATVAIENTQNHLFFWQG